MEFLTIANDTFQCRVLYLTSRPISHRRQTKDLLYGVKSEISSRSSSSNSNGGGGGGSSDNSSSSSSNSKALSSSSIFLPEGPLLMNRQHTIRAAYSELITKSSENFKFGVLQDITRTYCIAKSVSSASTTKSSLSSSSSSLSSSSVAAASSSLTTTATTATSINSNSKTKRYHDYRDLIDSEYLKFRRSKYYSNIPLSVDCLGVDCLGVAGPATFCSVASDIIDYHASNSTPVVDRKATKSESIERFTVSNDVKLTDSVSNADSDAAFETESVEVPSVWREEVQILVDEWHLNMFEFLPESLNYTQFVKLCNNDDVSVSSSKYLSATIGIPAPLCSRLDLLKCLFLIRMSVADFRALSINDLLSSFTIKPYFDIDIVEMGAIYAASTRLLSATISDGIDKSSWFDSIELYFYKMYQQYKLGNLEKGRKRNYLYLSMKAPLPGVKPSLEKGDSNVGLLGNNAISSSEMHNLATPIVLGVGNKDADARAYFKANIQNILIINPSSILKTFDPPPELNSSKNMQGFWNKFKQKVGLEFQGYKDNRLVDFIDKAVTDYKQDTSYRQSSK